ncbi:MAG: DUF3955 domain-containing protein [Firmicutes bacterium]|nr:DUF3955 domain-containing protein [Bacillota bacterium]
MKNFFALIIFIIGSGCAIIYNIIGSEVSSDGTLVEPFFLIPLSYFFIAISIVIGLLSVILKFKKINDEK